MDSVKRIAIIGSTGSIGRQTIEIIRSFPGRFQIIALAAGRKSALLEEQVSEFKPHYVYFTGKQQDIGTCRYLPVEKMVTLPEIDIVVMAPSGTAGLKPTYLAAQAGKSIALANKESLVIAGDIITEQIKHSGGRILPVDSEHSAIWQCLRGESKHPARIILTASGGPFRNYTFEQLERVTPAQALKHPSWLMGPKVTIDSATLLNKGFEVIEAHHLFNIGYNDISVLIHPLSLIHSLVEFRDGSVKAQLSSPDMRMPIQYALSYPARWANMSLPRIDWDSLNNLPLEPPDTKSFPCLELAVSAGRNGASYPAVLCGAGEGCVELFLNGNIRFTRIPDIIKQVLDEHKPATGYDIETIAEIAQQAKQNALEIGRKRG